MADILLEKYSGRNGWDRLVLLIGRHQDGSLGAGATHEVKAIIPETVPDPVLVSELQYWTESAAPPRRQWKSGTVLVVDDEPKVVRVLEEFLGARGLTVLTAGSGEQALQALESCAPHVILLDIKLPGMDGLLALKKIKVRRPETTVIMISALEDGRLLAQALALGAFEYLTKPFDYASLEAVLLKRFAFEV